MGAFISDPGITSSYGQLLELAEALEAKILAMINLRRSMNSPGKDVLSLLIQARDEDGTGMTDAELIGQAAVLFGAAHLTTANSLTWNLFLLAQHPRVASELVDELTGNLHGQAPSLEQMEQLSVLDRVLKESMRVLPASAYSQRINVEPVKIGPLQLPKGTPIIFSQIITHHMPDLFPEPERFLPDRWLGWTTSPYAYMPFAAGPRMCLGGPLAMTTLKVTLPLILQRFRLTVVPGATINGQVRSTMLAPTNGMPMIVSEPTAPFTANPMKGNIHELVELREDVPAKAA
jgi:cytochrome P450